MSQAVKLITDLNQLERIVLVSKDNNGTVRIAHSFYYGGRDGSEYLLFLYRDALPSGNFIEAWNYLDDNSVNTTIVGVHDHRTAIEDFIACWDQDKKIEDIQFYQVKDFSEIDDLYEEIKIPNNSIIAFGIIS